MYIIRFRKQLCLYAIRINDVALTLCIRYPLSPCLAYIISCGKYVPFSFQGFTVLSKQLLCLCYLLPLYSVFIEMHMMRRDQNNTLKDAKVFQLARRN